MAHAVKTDDMRPVRIGMIVPSSNTCLEPMTYRMLGDRQDVTVHSARIPVTRIALDGDSDRQFDTATMLAAAELLATADVDVIAWNGTSGSWLGPDHDREVTEAITRHTGILATTSTLAYLDAFERFAGRQRTDSPTQTRRPRPARLATLPERSDVAWNSEAA